MADDDRLERLTRVRREPPPLRPVTVAARVELSPRMLRLTLEGEGLRQLVVEQPAASVRLLVPTPGTDDLVMPEWNGNEFLLPDGSRPALRTFTPLRVDNETGRLDVEIVRHPGGAVSGWAETATPGTPAAISGPGTGYDFPAGAEQLIVLADETALPAALQVAETAPDGLVVHVHIEALHAEALRETDLPDRQTVEWHVTEPGATPGGRLVDVVRSLDSMPDVTYVWAAGEASAMQAIRGHLFDTLGLPRRRAGRSRLLEACTLTARAPYARGMGHTRRVSAFVAVLGVLVAACSAQPGVRNVASEPTPTTPVVETVPPPTTIVDQPTPDVAPTTTPIARDATIEFGSCDEFAEGAPEAPGPEWQCGVLDVPLDHDDPGGALVELAVTRRAGQRSRGEALVINPGGPGGAGLPFAWALAEHLPADVLRLFDVVSWDPRGVGVSNPAIVCPNGARWADPDLLGRCDRSTGELMAHMSTGNHVDDLEALRMALGGERLNYLGYSYGTYLGARYANRFPDRVGRFVLDGATHPDAGTPEAPRLGGEPWYAAESLEEVEARFFELCDLAAACELGDDSRVTFLDLMASVAELPTEAFGGEERIDAITLEAVVATSMSDPFNWGVLATALEDAQRGDASTLDALADLLEVSNAYFGEVVDLRESNEAVANPTIYCADFQAVPAAPAYCDGVPANSQASAALGAVDVAEPMLVIGTAFDPNTPGRHAGELVGSARRRGRVVLGRRRPHRLPAEQPVRRRRGVGIPARRGAARRRPPLRVRRRRRR